MISGFHTLRDLVDPTEGDRKTCTNPGGFQNGACEILVLFVDSNFCHGVGNRIVSS